MLRSSTTCKHVHNVNVYHVILCLAKHCKLYSDAQLLLPSLGSRPPAVPYEHSLMSNPIIIHVMCCFRPWQAFLTLTFGQEGLEPWQIISHPVLQLTNPSLPHTPLHQCHQLLSLSVALQNALHSSALPFLHLLLNMQH